MRAQGPVSPVPRLSTARILTAIAGLGCGLLLLVFGAFIFMGAQLFSGFAGEMQQSSTTTIEFSCETCGLEDAIPKGAGLIYEGSPCGYIDADGACPGTYTVTEREMTAEELQKRQQGMSQWREVEAGGGTASLFGVVVVLIGLVAIGLGIYALVARPRASPRSSR